MPDPTTNPHARPRRPRVALAHDWLCGYRGGEAVLDRIAHLVAGHYDCAGLWVMVDDRRPISPAVDRIARHTSFLQLVPGGPTSLRRWMLPFFPGAVAHLSRSLLREHRRDPIDLLISTSSAAIKGLSAPPGVPHLCYCHAPARYIWSVADEYRSGAAGSTGLARVRSALRDVGLRFAAPMLRSWDAKTASRVRLFLANSSHTRHEIRRCYDRDSRVIFPPVRTTLFTPGDERSPDSFWLVVGALEPYKRVDLAIAAANRTGHALVIAGDGSSRASLERLAGPSVRFLGRVGDAALAELYRTAGLLLFPQVEDFGIVSVEAQACGLPVVARDRGGALDTVIPGVTGALFGEPTVEALLGAISRVPANAAVACRSNAERFSEPVFDAAIHACVEELLGHCREKTSGSDRV